MILGKNITLADRIKRIGLILISRRLKPLEFNRISIQKIKNVLILRNDGLGDWVLTTPLVKALKQINPNINIDVIASPRNSNLISLDEKIRAIYELHHRSKFFEIIRLAFKIRNRCKYDLMIATKHTKITNTALLFTIINPNAYKIAFKIGKNQNSYTRKSYQLVFNYIFNDDLLYYELLQNMLKKVAEEYINFDVPYVLNEKFTLENKKSYPLKKIEKILFNTTGFEKPRIFNIESIKKILEVIRRKLPNSQLAVTSSPDYYKLLDDLSSSGIVTTDEILKLGIEQFIRELPNFDLIITPDTSIVHFAYALNIPQVIFYDTNEKYHEWRPVYPNFVALIGNGDINNIPVENFEEVLEALIRRLGIRI